MQTHRTNSAELLAGPALRELSTFEKGVYLELLLILDARGGYITADKSPMDADRLAGLIGQAAETLRDILNRLCRCGLLARTANGCLYCPELVRAAEKARLLSAKRTCAARTRWNRHRIQMKYKRTANVPEAPKTAQNTASAYIGDAYARAHQNDNNINIKKTHIEAAIPAGETQSTPAEPPPGMPKTEDEAVTLAEQVGVPAEFIRQRAYPEALARGWMINSQCPIRHWAMWVKTFYTNSRNAQARRAARSPQAKNTPRGTATAPAEGTQGTRSTEGNWLNAYCPQDRSYNIPEL